MNEVILHHYPGSPYAEKIRLILGFKNIPWRSVIIPMVAPKPDLVALTGGYRKTPVLQIGADIYCDTARIADALEAHTAAPTLYPPAVEAASRILAQWADFTLFWTMIFYALQPPGLAHVFADTPPEAVKAFGEDRAKYRASVARIRGPEATAGFKIYLKRLESMLGEQIFFFGAEPSIADFSIYHSLWYVQGAGPMAALLEAYPRLLAFAARMCAIGHATHEDLSSVAAIEVARGAQPGPSAGSSCDTHGLAAGQRVVIAATDTGPEPVEGTLHAMSDESISIAREDPRAGSVVVHFPRLGFELKQA